MQLLTGSGRVVFQKRFVSLRRLQQACRKNRRSEGEGLPLNRRDLLSKCMALGVVTTSKLSAATQSPLALTLSPEVLDNVTQQE